VIYDDTYEKFVYMACKLTEKVCYISQQYSSAMSFCKSTEEELVGW